MANPLNHIVVGKRKVALFILNKRYFEIYDLIIQKRENDMKL